MPRYQIRAVNSATDSENRIHDNTTAAAYGFRGGLVPGVTVFGYMIQPVLDHFGLEWLERGAMSVRFREPVYEREIVDVDAQPADAGRLQLSLAAGRALAAAWMNGDAAPPDFTGYPDSAPPPESRRPPASHQAFEPGRALGTLVKRIDLAAARLTEPLPAAIGPARLVHPAVLLGLSNEILMRNVVLGPWIHAASEIANFAPAHDGDTLSARGRVIETYERKGHEFVVLDVVVAIGNRAIQQVRHTAIWKPRPKS